MKGNAFSQSGRRSFIRNTLTLLAMGVPLLWSCSRNENPREDQAREGQAGEGGGDMGKDTDMSDSMTAGHEGKAAKADVNYQDHPDNGRHCSLCRNFIPPQGDSTQARCHVVEGVISPDGYCDLFTPKA